MTIHNPSGAINSSGYFSNKIPCPIHGGEDKNAAVSAISGGIFCHSHCGKVTSVDVAEHYDIDWKTIVYGERDARVKRFRTARLDTAPSQPETMEAWVQRTVIPRLHKARVTQHEDVWDAASDDEWNKHPLIITQSPLGSGKTQVLERIFEHVRKNNKYQHPELLGAAPTINLTAGMSSRLQLESYSVGRAFLPGINELAVCFPTLSATLQGDGSAKERQVVALDEIDQLIAELKSPLFEVSTASETLQALKRTLRNAEMIRASSAFIPPYVVDLLTEWTGISPLLIDNRAEEGSGETVSILRSPALVSEQLFASLANESNKAPHFFVTDSLTEAGLIHAEAIEDFKIPAADILMFTGDTSSTDECIAVAKDPSLIANYRLVILTPAALSGMNYLGEVTGTWGIFRNPQVTASAIMQILHRARKAQNLNVYIKPGVRELETDSDKIYSSLLANATDNDRRFGTRSASDAELRELLLVNAKTIAWQNLQNSDRLSWFVGLATEHGHQIEFPSASPSRTTVERRKLRRKAVKLLHKALTLHLEAIDKQTLDDIRHNRRSTAVAKHAYNRHLIEHTMGVHIHPRSYYLFNTAQKRR